MHLLEIQPPGGATCISQNFGHQVAPLALVRTLATRWRHMHCHIAWDFLIGSSVSINCVFSSLGHVSKVFNSGHQLRSSTRVFNQGHQLGSSTRVINQGHQLGSSTRVSLASLHQLDLHNIDNIDSLHYVFTRFQKALGRSDGQSLLPNDRTPCAHGSDKKQYLRYQQHRGSEML